LSFSLGNIRHALPQLPYCGYLHGSPRGSEYLLRMRSALPDRSLSVLFREDSAMTPFNRAAALAWRNSWRVEKVKEKLWTPPLWQFRNLHPR